MALNYDPAANEVRSARDALALIKFDYFQLHTPVHPRPQGNGSCVFRVLNQTIDGSVKRRHVPRAPGDEPTSV